MRVFKKLPRDREKTRRGEKEGVRGKRGERERERVRGKRGE